MKAHKMRCVGERAIGSNSFVSATLTQSFVSEYPHFLMGKTKIVRLPKPSAIVCDIDGTTTSPSFYSEKMKPYLNNNLKKYLTKKWDTSLLQVIISELRSEVKNSRKEYPNIPELRSPNDDRDDQIDSADKCLQYCLKKHIPLESVVNISILVWMYGYEREEIKGQ